MNISSIHYLIISNYIYLAFSQCNTTAFNDWKQLTYKGPLKTDSSFWRYQTQTFFVLNNGLALDLAVSACSRLFDNLMTFKAGRMGPVDIQTAYKQMCNSLCLESDSLHQQALEYTQCSCLELSPQLDDASYTKEGMVCLQNSARLLCDKIGFCGIWNCRLDDFMCPRYEWNKKLIPYKGPGTCIRNSSSRFHFQSVLNLVVVLVGVVSYLAFFN